LPEYVERCLRCKRDLSLYEKSHENPALCKDCKPLWDREWAEKEAKEKEIRADVEETLKNLRESILDY